MIQAHSVELREHNKDWYEVKVWMKMDNGAMINITDEANLVDINKARRIAAAAVEHFIIDGIDEIRFFHSKPKV